MRASEIETPAPPGHFLREFGQSDREVIENASSESSVPQALTLLNGVFYKALFDPKSPLSKNLLQAESSEEKIKVLFLSILNRNPSARRTYPIPCHGNKFSQGSLSDTTPQKSKS